MGRLRLRPGTAGEIKVRPVKGGFVARCWYRMDDGSYRDVRRRGRTKELAKQAVRDAVKDLKSQGSGVDIAATTLFSVVAQLWLDSYRAEAENGIWSLGSVDVYESVMRNHVTPELGKLQLIEAKTPIINRLCQNKLKAYSLSTAKLVKAVVGNVMTFAVQAGALDANPVNEIDKLTEKRAKVKKKTARALTKDQVLDLLGKLDADEEAQRRDLPDLIRYFLATGERLGEALGAHWSDFDEQARELRMTGNLVQVRRRGAVRNDGKSENAKRPIPLPGWCVHLLIERRTRLDVSPADEDGPIFRNTQGGYLNASNLNNRYWLPFRKRAGYEWVTFHTFRKTVATLLDDAGLTARQVADILGHANPSMTQDVYFGRGQVTREGAKALDRVIRQRENRQ